MNVTASMPGRGLYLLTPEENDPGRLLALVEPLLGEGVAVLQLRNKSADRILRRRLLASLLPACQAHGIPLLVNDDWRLAAELGAAGAHLGEQDGSLAEARRELGEQAILGASCYDDPTRAGRARDAGASYAAFGAFFPSVTKPDARRAPLSVLHRVTADRLPTVAIGGITADNGRLLIDAGADYLAVLDAVFGAADPVIAVRALRRLFSREPNEPSAQ